MEEVVGGKNQHIFQHASIVFALRAILVPSQPDAEKYANFYLFVIKKNGYW